MNKNNNQQEIESETLYVFQDTRDGTTIKGYASEGVFKYWIVQPINWESVDDKSLYMATYQLLERVNNGGLKQLN